MKFTIFVKVISVNGQTGYPMVAVSLKVHQLINLFAIAALLTIVVVSMNIAFHVASIQTKYVKKIAVYGT